PDGDVRRDVLRRVQREKIPARLATLKRWLEADQQPDRVAAILDSLKERPAKEVRGLLASIVSDKKHSPVNRLAALETLAGGLDETSQAQLLELAAITEDGPILARILRFLLKRPKLDAVPLLVRKANSPHPEVRAAAIEVLTERQ